MLQTLVAVAAAMVLVGCGDNLLIGIPDAAVDAAPDAPAPDLLGETCPTASVPGLQYLCHGGAGACVSESDGNHCRPWCGDDQGVHCRQLGGVLFDPPNTACVCVPPPPHG